MALYNGDYVIYRNPALFLAGQPNHTTIAKVTTVTHLATADLVDIKTGAKYTEVPFRYLREITAKQVMGDIDLRLLNAQPAPVTSQDIVAATWQGA